MNDTETRLRDYLRAKANTVPDDAHGPGLDDHSHPSRHRGWIPITLAAATIGAVLILTVPFLTSLSAKDSQPDPANTPQPTATGPTRGPVSTEPPRIPYTVTVHDNHDNPLDTWWRTLHDRGKSVRNPGAHGNVLARLGDNWLITTGYPDYNQLAILEPTGKLKPFGPRDISGSTFSPDRRQLAVGVSKVRPGTVSGDSRVIVLDVATGNEVSKLELPGRLIHPAMWTKDGIWLTEGHGPNVKTKIAIWQPGSEQAREVRGAEPGILLRAMPGTDKVIGMTEKNCIRVGALRGDEFVAEPDYCDPAYRDARPVLSRDGRTLFNTGRKLAVDLATGRTTKVQVPDIVKSWPEPVFEDGTHVIAVADNPSRKPIVEKMYRCSVATGECKLLRTAKSGESLAAIEP